ncbi:uncharacterized protein MELLADRAFT_91176 [Melampsora larici-populina 98AG31]|uniref:Uncharacterized protein n=1 Tax=Melampsora larici-populina (strain 98AG31 / pathotype 3-4-7) TaxID=747676 RepID=F4RY38_MELLP|nr:uncharacterized protein MELLADRAFT_91176 [Melampsora larici-populina 98AG31]EGG02613.1 hypothetical protein MELLADRAFT_91176 [Melampsora larici-populina 98AG31]
MRTPIRMPPHSQQQSRSRSDAGLTPMMKTSQTSVLPVRPKLHLNLETPV